MKAVRVSDLKDQTGMTGPRPSLFCTKCQAQFSANAGDYLISRPNQVFRHCRRNMILVLKRTIYEEQRI